MTDPNALADSEDAWIKALDEVTAQPRHVAYAVSKIDQALAGLRFEPGCETMTDAGVVLQHLASLSRVAAESLVEMPEASHSAADVNAAASLLEAAATTLLARD